MRRQVATEDRVIFLERKGFGSIVKSFSYGKLNSVEMAKGLIFSEMTITSGVTAQWVKMVPRIARRSSLPANTIRVAACLLAG